MSAVVGSRRFVSVHVRVVACSLSNIKCQAGLRISWNNVPSVNCTMYKEIKDLRRKELLNAPDTTQSRSFSFLQLCQVCISISCIVNYIHKLISIITSLLLRKVVLLKQLLLVKQLCKSKLQTINKL